MPKDPQAEEEALQQPVFDPIDLLTMILGGLGGIGKVASKAATPAKSLLDDVLASAPKYYMPPKQAINVPIELMGKKIPAYTMVGMPGAATQPATGMVDPFIRSLASGQDVNAGLLRRILVEQSKNYGVPNWSNPGSWQSARRFYRSARIPQNDVPENISPLMDEVLRQILGELKR